MPHDLKNRAGIGLPIAMGAMVLIGIIIAAGAFASLHDYRIDRNTIFQERALAAAEEGQARIVQSWPLAWNTALSPGDTLSRDYTLTDGSSAHVVVTRLNAHTFWVMSDGAASQTSRQLNARRRTNLILRLHVPNLRIPGAVSAREGTRATGSALMGGDDLNPAGWECDPPGAPVPGIATDSLSDGGTAGGCTGGLCISTSAPGKLGADTLLRDTATFSQYGGLNYDSLKIQAATAGQGTLVNVTGAIGGIGPTYNGDGSCNTADPKNWGDPRRNAVTPGKCEDHFPVVYLKSAPTYDVVVNGGFGQGIMIVDGNLKLNGTFEWYGPIIVRGNFSTNGTVSTTGVKVFGGVMAANLNCNTANPNTTPCNDITGNSKVQFSRCAITSAVTRNARAVLATRSWADLF